MDYKAIILAAGKGSRMNSLIPKVLHSVAGKPILQWIIDTLHQLPVSEIIIITSPENNELIKKSVSDSCTLLVQHEPLGTAHAVLSAQDYLIDFQGQTFVLVGDAPALSIELLQSLIIEMKTGLYSGAFLTHLCKADIPPWGRVLYNTEHGPVKVIEEKDANDAQKSIREVSSSHYLFDNQLMFQALNKISNHNQQNEYYLTDIVEIMAQNHKMKTILTNNLWEIYGVNTRQDLKIIEDYITRREHESS